LDPETKLPVKKMTVYKPGSDSTYYCVVFCGGFYQYGTWHTETSHVRHPSFCSVFLYDLCIVVKPSTIPNGGYGAFLTFEGARRLTKAALERQEIFMEQYEHRVFEEKEEELEAWSSTGHGVAVELVSGGIRHGSSGFVSKFDGTPPPKVEGGIGLLGLFTEKDYRPAPKVKFETTDLFVDLGLYGPFRKKDRLTEEIYTIKNHIFSNGPSGYGFDISEKIRSSDLRPLWMKSNTLPEDAGRKQVIDITDDIGMPHDIARVNVPMCVTYCRRLIACCHVASADYFLPTFHAGMSTSAPQGSVMTSKFHLVNANCLRLNALPHSSDLWSPCALGGRKLKMYMSLNATRVSSNTLFTWYALCNIRALCCPAVSH
jgi:hypothetical protein